MAMSFSDRQNNVSQKILNSILDLQNIGDQIILITKT